MQGEKRSTDDTRFKFEGNSGQRTERVISTITIEAAHGISAWNKYSFPMLKAAIENYKVSRKKCQSPVDPHGGLRHFFHERLQLPLDL